MVGYFLHAEDCAVSFLVDMNELCEARNRRIDDFVAENDGKGFVADQPLSAEDRMAEPESHRLTDVAEICERGDVPHLAQELRLAVILEIFFQFDGPI